LRQCERLRDEVRRIEDRHSEALAREKTLQVQNTELLGSNGKLRDELKEAQAETLAAQRSASELQGKFASLMDERKLLWERLGSHEDQRIEDMNTIAILRERLEQLAKETVRD